jgi:hypothetical protein
MDVQVSSATLLIAALWATAGVWVLGVLSVGAVLCVLGDMAWGIVRAGRAATPASASVPSSGEVSVRCSGGRLARGWGSTNWPNLLLTVTRDQVMLREMRRLRPAKTIVYRQSDYQFRFEREYSLVEDKSGMRVRLGTSDAEQARRALLAFGWLAAPGA